MRTERDAGFGLLRTEEARPGFDDGHLRPEPRERLPELDADGAAAEDGERAGELTRQHRLAVGPEFYRVEPRNGRNQGGAPVGDHDRTSGDQRLAPHLDGLWVDELSLSAYELGASRLHGRRGPGVVEVPRHPVDPLGDFGEIQFPVHARGCQRAGACRLLERLAGPQQGLRRDASPIRTLAPHELALDDREGESAALQSACDRLTRHAAAKAHDVKFLWQPHHLPPRSRGATIPTAKWP